MDTSLQRVLDGERLSYAEGVRLLKALDWFEICKAGWQIRCQKHGSQYTSYTMFRVVNYTNVCAIDCKFCSFQEKQESQFAYVLSKEEVFQKVEEALNCDADQIFFQGGVHPTLALDYYTDILSGVKQKYGVHIRGFSPVELLNLSQINNCSVGEVLKVLKNAGLDSVPGAGAELLAERMRQQLSPQKCKVEEWRAIMEECHQQGLPGSATMVVGGGETIEEIVMHLETIRQIQDKTEGFYSFTPWLYQQQTKRFQAQKMRPEQFLKILAFSRIYLDNIDNLETSVMVLGKDLGKMALRVGANDISSVVIEENVLKSYGLSSEEEAVRYLEEAGFSARRRDFSYQFIPESSTQNAVA
ncbi:MAG: CofH family radical SAM protein [SAR324 cluster bacterium]|nr:CofH family radical SAM protein [SAR324 cluster bacterium]